MIENAFLVFLVQSAILIVATHVALLFVKRSPALRQAIIRATLVGCVALAAFSIWSFNQPPANLPRPSARVTLPSLPIPARASTQPSFTPEVAIESAPPAPSLLPELPVALAVWLVGVLVGSLYLAAGLVKLRRLKQHARSWKSPEFEQLAAELGHRKVAVRTGSSIRTPFVTGVIRPTIFLPESLTVNPDPTLELVLRHELAHVTNRDLGFLLLHRVLTIVLWPQVLLWTLRRPMLEASEEVCDRIALSTSAGSHTLGTDYAKALLALHNQFQSDRVSSLGVGMVRKQSGLKRRVAAILDPNQRPPNNRRKYIWVAATLLLAGTVTTLIAAPMDQTDNNADPNHTELVFEPYTGSINLVNSSGIPIANGAAQLAVHRGNRVEVQLLPVKNGKVVLPEVAEFAHTGYLFVDSTEGIGWTQLWPAKARVTEVKLLRPEKLTGKLLLPNGAPATRMDVSVRQIRNLKDPIGGLGSRTLLLDQHSKFFKLTANTDDNGNYEFNRLPADSLIRLEVMDLSVAAPVTDDDILLGSTGITIAKTQILRAAGSISGRVIQNGKPVEGVRIDASSTIASDSSDSWGSALTKQDGTYTIDRLLPSTYNVILDFDHLVRARSTSLAKERVSVEAGKNVANQNFEIVDGAIVSGTVRDSRGQPIRGAEVFIYSRAHPKSTTWVRSVLADNQGRYQHWVPAGAISMRLSGGIRETIDTEVKEGTDNTIDLVRTKKHD